MTELGQISQNLGLRGMADSMASAVVYAQVKHLWLHGLTAKEIALRLDLHVSSVRWRLKKLGLMENPALRTVCFQGHEYTPENTIVQKSTGHRQCRQCKRRSGREYERRNRAKRNERRPIAAT